MRSLFFPYLKTALPVPISLVLLLSGMLVNQQAMRLVKKVGFESHRFLCDVYLNGSFDDRPTTPVNSPPVGRKVNQQATAETRPWVKERRSGSTFRILKTA
ncbi:hypothetical protein EHT25_02225 [Larkinella rosea]|uniref:Uncharacterized protein n=2 Tax=Larkinella rosea TaxID=2025312 RepID=A0A3P1BZQ2_9BACT|nr:hypothetical protein EHT25_02225 [Larkinella rosea]